MKLLAVICISISLSLASCALFNPDKFYEPKSADEFYFPALSGEYIKRKNACIQEKKFPCNLLEPNDSLDEFVNRWYSKHLKSLKEPILYKLYNEDKDIIRFTNLGTWSNPFSYRIENNNGQITGIYNLTDGQGGYKAGNRIEHKEKTLNKDSWEQLLLKINSVGFWKIRTHDPNMILDGEEWILEILIDGKYHVVTRNSPDNYDGKQYAELCKLVINIFEK